MYDYTQRTTNFANAWSGFRRELRAIWQKFDETEARLKKYRGSGGYTDELNAAIKERDNSIAALREHYRGIFSEQIAGMRQTTLSRKLPVPSDEAVRLLSVLKMRETLTRDELTAAARTLQDDPVSLSVLDEIGRNAGVYGILGNVENPRTALEHLLTLESAVDKLMALEKCDSRAQMANRANPDHAGYRENSMYSYRADRDFASTKELFEYEGGVGNFDEFAKIVNGGDTE